MMVKELHNETKNDDENSLQFLKDEKYTFYQIPGASHEHENAQKTENTTEQVYLSILINCCIQKIKFRVRRKSLSLLQPRFM